MARFLDVNTFDTANGPGVRVSVFFSGCPFRCQGCWNPASWNPRNGKDLTDQVVEEVVAACGHEGVRGLSVLGGEPLASLEALRDLLTRFRSTYGASRDVWLWSGWTWEEAVKTPEVMDVLSMVDVMVDGRFVLALRDTSLRFRGSSNQRVLDVRRSVQAGGPVCWKEPLGAGGAAGGIVEPGAPASVRP